MRLRTILIYGAALLVALTAPANLAAQDSPARRLGNIVGVALDEYAKGVDARGAIVLQLEYDEAVAFLTDARALVDRVNDARAPQLAALIDEMRAGVNQKLPPAALADLQQRFTQLLGPDASLDYPTSPVSLAEGKAIYEQRCASCHGATGGGDGFAAVGISPAPPAFADRSVTADVTPALMYRVVSVGVRGTMMAGFTDLSPEQRWAVVTYVTTLRASNEQVERGRALITAHCVRCDGKEPPQGQTFGWLAERHDVQLASAIAAGDVALGLDSGAQLQGADADAVVAALRANPLVVTAPQRTPAMVAADVLAILDRAIEGVRVGDITAGDLAFDAYVAFEPLESQVRTRDPGLVALLERHFADFKGAVNNRDIAAATGARSRIASGLPQMVDLASRKPTVWAAFVESFLIIVREGFEAILILGAIIAFLVRTGNQKRVREIWAGAGVGLLASAVLAVVLKTVLANAPASREVIEGATMLVAVGVLFSVSYWMLTKVESQKWQAFIKDQLGAALTSSRASALAVVAFLAVFREGAETALFYQALFMRGPSVIPPVALGFVVGSVCLVGVWFGIQRFGLRLPLRQFFGVTSTMLYTLAFIFMGKGLRELQEGNVLSITPIDGGPYVGFLGIFPSVETLVGQGILLALALYALWRTLLTKSDAKPAPRKAAAVSASVPVREPVTAEAE
jgi:high-affinity iron transporter